MTATRALTFLSAAFPCGHQGTARGTGARGEGRPYMVPTNREAARRARCERGCPRVRVYGLCAGGFGISSVMRPPAHGLARWGGVRWNVRWALITALMSKRSATAAVAVLNARGAPPRQGRGTAPDEGTHFATRRLTLPRRDKQGGERWSRRRCRPADRRADGRAGGTRGGARGRVGRGGVACVFVRGGGARGWRAGAARGVAYCIVSNTGFSLSRITLDMNACNNGNSFR